MSLVIALDPGFGNTKVASSQGVFVLQSAVARPREIGMAAKGLEAQARPQTVTLSNGGIVCHRTRSLGLGETA